MLRAGLVLLCLGGPACAQGQTDGIVSQGLLSDIEFFRLVTCGAVPGGPCKGPVQRWGKRMLRIALVAGTDPVPEAFEARLLAAIDPALDQINGTKAGITILRSNSPDADIKVIPTALPEGSVLTEVPGFSGPGVMGVGYMTVWSDDANQINEAVILISTTITDQDLPSVMLEEITQSLGPLFDIENPAYEGVSILSQTSNLTTTIAGQDAALLRWIYPPQN
ncbi:DUF2927 domain-containing protein [Tabrizicola sp.]|uniref:DUF2927 domain-containing protein n=1 Tax=Tabrizicola sp. TaxID=2005166 RepID=UPI00286B9B87|nr:DUF2927 domain-containing protein [Tabrizicola sp.]